jgi:nitrogen regulatory protein P-II 1
MAQQIQTAPLTTPVDRPRPRRIMIEAVVEPSRLEELKEEVAPWAAALIWSEVNVHTAQERTGVYRGVEYRVDSVPMVKLELIVSSAVAPRVADAIDRMLGAGGKGGRLLAVFPLDDLVRRRSAAEEREPP